MDEIMVGIIDDRPNRDHDPWLTHRDVEAATSWASEFPDINVFLVRVTTDVF